MAAAKAKAQAKVDAGKSAESTPSEARVAPSPQKTKNIVIRIVLPKFCHDYAHDKCDAFDGESASREGT